MSEKKQGKEKMTPYHSQYYAHELTKRCSSEKIEKLSQSLFNATVDMNPHQIEAALFAFRSPLSRGAILADEVGLGKTIEAALIISQLWAERKRRILIIVPTSLRKQWNRELIEKFFLSSQILETRLYNALKKQGRLSPFELDDEIAICSYHFARSKADDIRRINWDLVIIDEAHRLRNVYKKSTKIARAILEAIQSRPKVLLTATPLQNNLMELYGLTQFIDQHIFGDEVSFRSLFGRNSDLKDGHFTDLKARLRPICQRTLRRQVTEYVPYTNRLAIAQDFTPSEREQRLYDEISEYLSRDELLAMPSSQRQLITMVFRKLLASSTFAIAGTLETLVARLKTELTELQPEKELTETVAEDFESLEEIKEEWAEEEESPTPESAEEGGADTRQIQLLKAEIGELEGYRDLAVSITENAKGQELLTALEKGFAKLAELGAARKAVIFTESRRTQAYLKLLLEEHDYQDEIVLFNGTNTDPESQQIYKEWSEQHTGDDQITGSRTADMRSALVEHFRDRASILITTESGAEGINLQFASLVVNYDLPWNPQRIEQRIGRCHRYGQKHDVVVVNFLNRKNAADVRVFQLLSEKFRLFDGVFGASDEVLGAIESGVDFEKRIADIYQNCRTLQQIEEAFNTLQKELEEQISTRLADTRQKLLEHFDEEVHERLRFNREQTRQQISRLEDWLWLLTQYELDGLATFNADQYAFHLEALPDGMTEDGARCGHYQLLTRVVDRDATIHYRPGHPLAETLIERAKKRQITPHEVTFLYGQHPTKISIVENLLTKTGWLSLTQVSIEALDAEDHLVFAALTDDGKLVDQEICERLFSVAGNVGAEISVPLKCQERLMTETETSTNSIIEDVSSRNNNYFEQEMEKVDKWAEDLKESLEIELKELDVQIKSLKREARLAADLQTKLDYRRKASELEKQRHRKRRGIFEAQDEIENKRENLIAEVENRLKQTITRKHLFTIRWSVI